MDKKLLNELQKRGTEELPHFIGRQKLREVLANRESKKVEQINVKQIIKSAEETCHRIDSDCAICRAEQRQKLIKEIEKESHIWQSMISQWTGGAKLRVINESWWQQFKQKYEVK